MRSGKAKGGSDSVLLVFSKSQSVISEHGLHNSKFLGFVCVTQIINLVCVGVCLSLPNKSKKANNEIGWAKKCFRDRRNGVILRMRYLTWRKIVGKHIHLFFLKQTFINDLICARYWWLWYKGERFKKV